VFGPDYTSCAAVNTPNEAFPEVTVNVVCKRFRLKFSGNHKGIGKNAPIAVNPVSFILYRINNNSFEMVKENAIKQTSQARPVMSLQTCSHVIECFLLCIVQRSAVEQRK
jgi:hypothetical protein